MYSDDKLTVGNLTVRLEQDTDAESPRDWDNLGTMVCWHRNYNLGDKHGFSDPSEFRDSEEYKTAAIVLPLYLYDHSGITISCKPFSCPWDSGQVGYVYISKDKIRKEYSTKRITKALLERVTGYLVNEVKTYDDYLTGNVWGFVVEDEDGEVIDSCWGFIGDVDNTFAEGKAAAESYLENETEQKQLVHNTFAL